MRSTTATDLDAFVDLLSGGGVLVLSGAGLSTESGIPDYRGPDGQRRVQPMQYSEFVGSSAARQRYWARSYVGWQRFSSAGPNAGHRAVAVLQQAGVVGPVITQNVDGLHERAGAKDVIRFHGSIWHLRCAQGCPRGSADWEDRAVPFPELPPKCPFCNGYARPAVVWFGESIDPDVYERCNRAANCDVFLSVGTSALVYPAAGLVHAAKARGAFTIEINPETTGAAAALDMAIPLAAEFALPLIEL